MRGVLRFARMAASAAIAFSVPVHAQQSGAPAQGDGLDISASMRLRYETVDGQVRPGFNPSDDLIDLRTIVTATYKAGPIRIGGEVYDSRAWGANARTPISTNEVNVFEPVQAWIAADIAHPFGKGTSLSVQGGRFLLNLGSRRLAAADDYRNTTNAVTGLRADLGFNGGVKATLVYVLPQMRLPDDLASVRDNKARLDRESFDLVLWGGFVSSPIRLPSATIEFGYLHLGERDGPGRPTRDRSLDTVDVRAFRDPKPGAADYEIEGIYQTGHISASATAGVARLLVRAWFAHARAGYTLPGGWMPRLSAEFDIASGDKAGGSYGRFDSLFGMRRADLGPVGLYNVVARSNVLTPGLRIEAVPNKRVDLMMGYRLLWLAESSDSFAGTGVRDPAGRSGSFAGQQIDARVRAWVVPKRLRFEADAVWLAKGRFLDHAPNTPAAGDSQYLSLNLTANL